MTAALTAGAAYRNNGRQPKGTAANLKSAAGEEKFSGISAGKPFLSCGSVFPDPKNI